MIIRRLQSRDKEELTKLLIAFDTPDYPLSDVHTRFRQYKDDIKDVASDVAEHYISDPQYIVFVAEEDNKLVGCICGEIKPVTYRKYDKEGYMTGWYVQPEYRQHGIGKQLYDKLIEAFKKADCTHIGLDTKAENTKAIEIYEHMGFHKRVLSFFKPLKDL